MRSVIAKILLVAIGALIGVLVGRFWIPKPATIFTNPLGEVRYSANKNIEEDAKIKTAAQRYIGEAEMSGDITAISVYFRGFGDGSWFGIGEDIPYAPASLLKVPLMIAYLKRAQINDDSLQEKIQYEGGEDKNEKEFTRSASSLSPGTYTVAELLDRMIIHSGNNSSETLEANVDKTFFKEVYTDLGLPFRQSAEDIDFVSAKQFAIVLRVLYNASYLNRPMSEYGLSLLSKTDFKDGLLAGVPQDVMVAHKFGERAYGVIENQKLSMKIEFHDCGIIYASDNPYILCIMTKGRSLEAQKHAIAGLSDLVYRSITK